MKCDTCKNQIGYILGPDECGSGTFDARCAKGHWQGIGLIDDNGNDCWIKCEDYEEDK